MPLNPQQSPTIVGIPWLNVKQFGAKGDGVTDDTNAIKAAVAASVFGSTIYFPPGTYLITSNILIGSWRHILCAGTQATIFLFNPTATQSCFTFSAGAAECSNPTFRGGCTFISTDTTFCKTAIELIDCDQFECDNVWVSPGSNTQWIGNTSRGFWIKGRQQAYFDNIRIQADRPVYVDVNPNQSTIVGMDHHHFSNCFFFSTWGGGNSCFYIEEGVIVTNLTFDGMQAWIVDKYGLYWKESGTTTSISANINLENVRCEQAHDGTGYSYYINHQTGVYGVEFNNCHTALLQNGYYFNAARQISLRNCVSSTNSNTYAQLTIAGGCFDFMIDNCYWATNATTSITGMTQIMGIPNTQSAATLPPWGWWSDSTTAANQPILFGNSSIGSMTFNGGITATFSGKTPTLLSTDTTVNGNYPRSNTSATYTGGAAVFGFFNNGSIVAYVSANGSVSSLNGTFEPTQVGVQLNLGTGVAGNIRIGAPANTTTIATNTVIQGDATTTARTLFGGFQAATGSGITTGLWTFSGATGAASDGTTAGATGQGIRIKGGTGGGGLTAANPGNGAVTTILGGDGGTSGSGNSNGGNVVIDGGAKQGTGVASIVLIGNGTSTGSITIGHTSLASGITMQTGSGGLSIQGNVGIAGQLNPDVDNSRTIGTTSLRYSSIASVALTAGSSTLTLTGASTGWTFNTVFDLVSAGTMFIGNGVATAVSIGSPNIITYLGGTGPSTGTGAVRVFNPTYLIGSAATSGTTLVNSPFYYMQSNYWTGSATSSLFGGMRMVASSATPHGYIQFQIGPSGLTEVGRIDDLGIFYSLPGGGFDVMSAGTLNLGTTNATAVVVGKTSITTVLSSLAINLGDSSTSSFVFARSQGNVDTAGGSSLFVGAQGGTASAVVGGAGGSITSRGGTGGTASASFVPGAGGSNSLLGGNAGTGGTGNASGGAAIVDAGTGSGTGVAGAVLIGTTAAASVGIGRTGITTTLNGQVALARTTLAQSTASMTLNFASASQIDVTLSASVTTITINGLAANVPCTVVLNLIQDATGTRTLAGWPATVKWLGSTYRGTTKTAPTFSTAASKRDTIFFYWDGTNLIETDESIGN